MRGRRLVSILVLITVILSVACAPAAPAPKAAGPTAPPGKAASSTEGQPKTKILFRESFIPDELFVPVHTARAKGFYSTLNLDVEQQPGQGAQSVVKLVGAGENPLGLSDSGTVLVGVSQGVPITAIGGVFHETLSSVISLKESNITKLSDLQGKTVGGIPGSAAHVHYLAALKANNVDASKITFVALSGDAITTSLAQKKVDAVLAFYSNVPVDLEAQGVGTNVIRIKDLGVDILNLVYIVNNDYLKNNRPVVEAFLRGSYQGLDYAAEHVDEVANLLVGSYPTLKPDVIAKKWKLDLEVAFTPASRDKPRGFMDPQKWENVQKILLDGGQIKSRVDLKTVYDNSLVEAIGKR